MIERTRFIAMEFSQCEDAEHIELMLKGFEREIKREVFDDIEKMFPNYKFCTDLFNDETWKDFKQKHLSENKR